MYNMCPGVVNITYRKRYNFLYLKPEFFQRETYTCLNIDNSTEDKNLILAYHKFNI